MSVEPETESSSGPKGEDGAVDGHRYLKFGDLIFLQYEEGGMTGFVSGEGFSDLRIYVSKKKSASRSFKGRAAYRLRRE